MKNNQYTATPNWFKDTTTSQTGSQIGQQVTNYYIQGGSSSGGGTIDMSQVWEALAADTTEQINKSHLTDALKDIGLEGDFVDLTSDQDITGTKNFVNGLKISDKLINIVDGVLYLDCNVAVTGGLTVYAQGTQDVPSIWDGAPFDNVTIHYNEETGLIEVIGGTGGGVSNWEDLQGKPGWITDTAPNNNIFPNTANYWVTDNNKITNWDNAVSKAHEHANKATLDKIYEKDGVIYWDGSLAVTGGITSYALGDVEVSTIMDGVVVDGTTIKKENGKLVVIGGSGSSFDEDAMWTALSSTTNEQINKSHLTTALSGYAIKSELNTSNWDTAYSWGNHANAGYAKQTALDDVSTKLNDFLEGSDTDTIINKWKELEAFLAGMSETDNLAEILSTKADKSYVDTELTKYVTLATEQTIDGLKHFTNGLTIGATKHKIYEKDGNILIEGNVLVTGGITAYSEGSGSGGSGGGGIDVDVLWEILGGTGTQQINVSHLTTALTWNNISSKPSWIGSTKPSYNWSEIGSKPTTLSGYGITDGVNAVTTTGTGNAVTSASVSGHTLRLTKGGTFLLSSAYTANDILTKLKTVDGANSGLDADTLDGVHNGSVTAIKLGSTYTGRGGNQPPSYFNGMGLKVNMMSVPVQYSDVIVVNGYGGAGNDVPYINAIAFQKTANAHGTVYHARAGYGASSWGTWYPFIDSYNIGSYNAGSATKLQTARTIWGQSFDGTANVDGDFVMNGNFKMIGNYMFLKHSSTNYGICLGTDSDGSLSFSGHNNYSWTKTIAILQYSTGNVGIGTTSPSYKLDVNGNTRITDTLTVSYTTRAGKFSAGEFQDDKYGYYNCTRPNTSGTFCCYAMVRHETIPFGIGYDSNNRIILGAATLSKTIITWLAIASNTMTMNGNILATGGITCYSSDQRAKTVIEQIKLSLKQIADAPTIRFKWNDWKIKDDGKTHIGGIAQYMQKLLPETVLEADGALNMDYSTTAYIFSVQTARHLQTYETRTDRKIKKLEKEVLYLKNQLKKLGHEEANIMDD